MQTATEVHSKAETCLKPHVLVFPANRHYPRRLRLLPAEVHLQAAPDLRFRPDRSLIFPKRQTILSIGDDAYLLRTREMVLESAGYVIQSIASTSRIEADLARLVDITVLCHTVPAARMAAIRFLLRRLNPRLPILYLEYSAAHPLDACEHVLELQGGPAALLRTIEWMLTQAKPDCGKLLED